jgi:hypothetical protein
VPANTSRPRQAVPYFERTRALYASQPPYRWVVNDPATDPPPWAPIAKPLARCRVALISSGGVYPAGGEPFHFRNDTSHREIPLAAARRPARLHFGYSPATRCAPRLRTARCAALVAEGSSAASAARSPGGICRHGCARRRRACATSAAEAGGGLAYLVPPDRSAISPWD